MRALLFCAGSGCCANHWRRRRVIAMPACHLRVVDYNPELLLDRHRQLQRVQ